MNKLLSTLLTFTMIISLLSACGTAEQEDETLTVAVSIVPQATFVEAVAGDLVEVVTMIPTGASPANYQPSPKEMTAFAEASIYYSIGVPTEASNILPNIAEGQEDLNIVYLADVVGEVYPPRYFEEDEAHDHDEHEDEEHDEDEDHDEHEDEDHDDHDDHDHSGEDPHIWMSPKRVVVMVEAIAETLSEADPDNASTYEANAQAYIEKLEALDAENHAVFDAIGEKEFIIMHPSLGYYAEDYGLEMVAIEEDGKDASVSHMQKVIDYGLEHDIHVVFYQAEFDSVQAETIADELNGTVQIFAPLTPDYIEGIQSLTDTFKSLSE